MNMLNRYKYYYLMCIYKDNRRNHVDMIKTTVKTEKTSVANNICPKCGGKLVERNGKYGVFKGCSNFPKCRYILNK